jgi:hypothetical protein
MISELAELRISVNVPRPFPCVRGKVWERDYEKYCKLLTCAWVKAHQYYMQQSNHNICSSIMRAIQ